MKLDQLVELAKTDSSKLDTTASIVEEYNKTQARYDEACKNFKDELRNQIDTEIRNLADLRSEFHYSTEEKERIIQIKDTKISLNFEFGFGSYTRFGNRIKLTIHRSDTQSNFFIDLAPAEEFKEESIHLDLALRHKVEQYGRLKEKEFNADDLVNLEKYINYLKLNIEYIESRDLKGCMYYLTNSSSAMFKPTFETSSFQEVVERALSLAPNLK